MSLVYLPIQPTNEICVEIRDTNTIRVYDHHPTQNSTISYTDYYIHSNYYSKSGSTTFNNYTTLPTCVPTNELTNEYGYRIDFMNIAIVAFLMLFTGYFFVSKLVRTIFIDWKYS